MEPDLYALWEIETGLELSPEMLSVIEETKRKIRAAFDDDKEALEDGVRVVFRGRFSGWGNGGNMREKRRKR